MKKILVIVLSNLNHDARVRRQVLALKDRYKVTVVCFGGDSTEGYELISMAPTDLTLIRKATASFFLLAKLHSIAHGILHHYQHIVDRLSDRQFDLIIANDVETLPLAFKFPGNPKVIFDAHEYAPRHFEDKLMWRLFFQDFNTWLCRKYIPLTAGMMTVGKGLALEYERHFGTRPVVITNANNYVDIEPTPVDERKIRLVHHGIATPSRRLELMIEMMSLLDDRFTLDLMLIVPGFASKKTRGYVDELRALAQADTRIKVIPPVTSREVVKTINRYDIGVFLLPPINFNYENTLPNKLFDFIQARLGIAIGPTPEMAEIVNRYQLGVVSEDFTASSLARQLSALGRREIEAFKENAKHAARELNAENNAEKIDQLVSSVIH